MADYSWQLKAVERFAKSKISAIVAACGTGKTRAAIRIALEKDLPVVVIAPKNICKQWKDEIMDIGGEDQEVFVYDAQEMSKHPDAFNMSFMEFLHG